MWMLALLGALGVALAQRRREGGGQPAFIEPLTQAVQAGEIQSYRDSLMQEGALVTLPVALPPLSMNLPISRRHVRAVQAGVR